MVISVKVLGIAQTKKYLKNTSSGVFIAANKAIAKSGFFIQDEVQKSIAGQRAEPVSVDTGRFLNSVKTVQNAPLTSTIESNVEYAKYLEYGTSRIIARLHFRNTAKRNEKKVRDFVNREIIKVTII